MANIQNFYDYELTYTGKYINEFLGTNAIDTVDYYADLNDSSKVPDARITGYETEEKISQNSIPPEHSKIFYVINDGRIDEISGEIVDIDGVETTEEIDGKEVEVIKYKRGFYQFIGYWLPTPGISGSYTLHRYWKYIEELSDGGKVFPKGYTAPVQMGLIETGDVIGNKTMKELFIAALGKDGWQNLPTFSYSSIKYLDSATANTGVNFAQSYQIGTALDIYGLIIGYKSTDGTYLSTSDGTSNIPVIGSSDDGNSYATNKLQLSGRNGEDDITPDKGTKSGTITLKFNPRETYSFTTIGTQTIVSITGTQLYPSNPSNSGTVEIDIATNKYINVGQYPIYYAYLTNDPSAGSTISNAEKISNKLQLQTSKLQDNIEYTVPVKKIDNASYLYIFVSTLISEASCTLSILNPEKTSAAKLDKLTGQVIISTGSTSDKYNKFYVFRVSNQTSGSAYSNWYIKYNKK